MRIYATGSELKLDKGRLNKALMALVDEIFYDAIKAFTEKTASAIPIWTGMARGSLLNLRTFLESHGRTVATTIPTDPYIHGKKYYHVGSSIAEPKEPETGVKYSTPVVGIYERVKYQSTFTFESRVRHLNINDLYNKGSINAPSDDPNDQGHRATRRPWKSFLKGRQAFVDSLRTNKRRLTNVRQFLSTTSITPGRQSGYPGTFRMRSRQIIR